MTYSRADLDENFVLFGPDVFSNASNVLFLLI